MVKDNYDLHREKELREEKRLFEQYGDYAICCRCDTIIRQGAEYYEIGKDCYCMACEEYVVEKLLEDCICLR